MRSATATRPVTDAEIEAFHRDGAVLLRGVLEPQWVDLVATGLDECYAQPDSMSSELVMPGAILRIDQFPAARSAWLRRFIEDSPVGSLVGAVLGAPVRFYMDQMFYKPAGELMATAWHQDTCYYNVDGHDLVRAWVSPDRVPRSAIRAPAPNRPDARRLRRRIPPRLGAGHSTRPPSEPPARSLK